VAGILNLELDGLIGLGFNSTGASDLTSVLTPLGATVGQPFLFNIFDMTPAQNNFIGILLSCTLFTINALDETYTTGIEGAADVPLFPENDGVWSILVDSINVDGVVTLFTLSNVPNMPNGSIVADIDTETPTTIFPPDILYSHILGAIVGVVGGNMSLFIFCNISGIITAVIGFVPASFILPALNHMLNGRGYPIHPLDLSQVEFDVDDNGNNFTACRATMVDLGAGSANDAVFGDSFMRNEYSVFRFGNNVAKSPTGAASIQFLSIFDPSMAAQDVQNARMVRLSSLPPEADFDHLKGALPATPSSTRPTSDTLPPDPTELPTSSVVPTSTQVAT
ncbi:hypothetical protein B0H14DRAFT_2241735, partial [Mycena olivaceomarginata]